MYSQIRVTIIDCISMVPPWCLWSAVDPQAFVWCSFHPAYSFRQAFELQRKYTLHMVYRKACGFDWLSLPC